MADNLDETYASYWDEFKLRTDEKEKTVEFLKTLKPCDLSVITSMVSIGAGKNNSQLLLSSFYGTNFNCIEKMAAKGT